MKRSSAELQVTDLQGKVLKHYPLDPEGETYVLDIRMYPKGVYLYRIVTSQSVSESFRLVKQ